MKKIGCVCINMGKAIIAPKGTLRVEREIVSESLFIRGVLFYTLCLNTGTSKEWILIQKAQKKEGSLIKCKILNRCNLQMDQVADEESLCAAFVAAREKKIVDGFVKIRLAEETVLIEQTTEGEILLYK